MSARSAVPIVGGVFGVLVLAVGLVVLLMSSMGDPPPDPSEAPLEVVANDADDSRCILNREDVAAGVHDFLVITEGSEATVELRDEVGTAVFESEGPQGSAVVEGQEGTAALQLGAGRYTVVCQYPDGSTGETPLIVSEE
jgi:hypothetical protein